jgi:sugar lactone lactonase YvrE
MKPLLASLFVWDSYEEIASGFGFTEGPLWHPDGHLLFNDIPRAQSWRVVPGQDPELIRENTGGANGQTFDIDGRVVFCEGGLRSDGGARRIARIDYDGSVTALVDRWDGKRLNAPNDIICSSDGSLYFTNPEVRVPQEEREIGYSNVLRSGPDGSVVEVCGHVSLPNGLALSPDERILYVTNTRPDPKIYAYSLDADGRGGDERVFYEMPVATEDAESQTRVPGGLKVDVEGRLYASGPGGRWVWEADGNLVGVIKTPEWPGNLAWGGNDNQTLFITARTSVISVKVTTPGVALPGIGSAGKSTWLSGGDHG